MRSYVYRQPQRAHFHRGVRALAWREPAYQAGYLNTSGQASLYTGPGLSLQRSVSPAVQVGDTFLTGNTSPGGYVVSVNDDGTINISLGGDSTRQTLSFLLFRRMTDTFDGPGLIWINEQPPIWAAAVQIAVQVVNITLAPIDLVGLGYVSSTSGDTLTFAVASGALPPGINLSSAGLLSGVPSVLGNYSFTISATDLTGTTAPSPQCFIDVQTASVQPPFTAGVAPGLTVWAR